MKRTDISENRDQNENKIRNQRISHLIFHFVWIKLHPNGWQTTHINNILLELLAAIEQSINERKRERKKTEKKESAHCLRFSVPA